MAEEKALISFEEPTIDFYGDEITTAYHLSDKLSPLTDKMSPILSLQSKWLCHIKCRCIACRHFHVCGTIQNRHFSV